MFRRHNTRPVVKKVSTMVNKRSHKQRKYISLMLVPSYSSGRTRSLRIPQMVFYCILITIIAVSAITAGFYLRSERFAQQYQHTRENLYNTQYMFEAFQAYAVDEQARLMEESLYIYEQLTEEQRMFRMEQSRLRHEQQTALDHLRTQIDDLERAIRAFDEQRQEIIDGLSARSIIPPVAALLDRMNDSQATILTYSTLSHHQEDQVGFGFIGFANEAPATEGELLERLAILATELELQMLLYEDIQSHRQSMEPHLRNFPTLWPINAEISSPFGWRANPMGGRGSEFHEGIDLRAPTGTPIRAAGGGTVIFSGWQGGYGRTVIINHGNGITTLYAHNSVNLVYEGQRVERGDIIARVGTTGRTTGPHVHYEVRINNTAVNPRPYMLERWSY